MLISRVQIMQDRVFKRLYCCQSAAATKAGKVNTNKDAHHRHTGSMQKYECCGGSNVCVSLSKNGEHYTIQITLTHACAHPSDVYTYTPPESIIEMKKILDCPPTAIVQRLRQRWEWLRPNKYIASGANSVTILGDSMGAQWNQPNACLMRTPLLTYGNCLLQMMSLDLYGEWIR